MIAQKKLFWYYLFKHNVFERTFILKQKQIKRLKRFMEVLQDVIKYDDAGYNNVFIEFDLCQRMKLPATRANKHLVIERTMARYCLRKDPKWEEWAKQFPL